MRASLLSSGGPATGSRPAPRGPGPLIYSRFRALPPPVIVIGMHRSGTSLVAGMLWRLGVFMGAHLNLPGDAADPAPENEWLRQSGYAEDGDFFALNELLLSRAGAAWNRIEPFLNRRERPPFAAASLATLQAATFGRLRGSYLSPVPPGTVTPWGWKDPRNSLTLPYWLRLFPEARVLHVRRSPDAAAASLHRRAHAWVAEPPVPTPLSPAARLRQAIMNPAGAARYLRRRLGLAPHLAATGDPCLDRDYCLLLGEQYVRECLRYRCLGERYLEIWYEDIVEAPAAAAGILARFAGCSPSGLTLRQAAAIARPVRAQPPARPHPRDRSLAVSVSA